MASNKYYQPTGSLGNNLVGNIEVSICGVERLFSDGWEVDRELLVWKEKRTTIKRCPKYLICYLHQFPPLSGYV